MKIFKDRKSAGKLLAAKLRNTDADLILAVPRGGVVVATEMAKALKTPFDILVIRKIGLPGQSELAVGALDPDGEVYWEKDILSDVEVDREQLGQVIKKEWQELKRREEVYRDGKKEPLLKNKRIMLVDDGIATGATILAAIRFLKRNKVDKIILAVPVASQDSLDKIRRTVDEVVVLEIPENFQAVGQFYEEFLPVSDEEVIQLLHG